MREIVQVPRLPPRSEDAHKGDFGRTLIIAGSVGLSGAAVLAGMGALRSGTGLVELLVPRDVWPIAAVALPEALTRPLPETGEGQADADAERLERSLRLASAALIGPGLGTGVGAARTLDAFLLVPFDGPRVFDADALNLFAAGALDLARLPRGSVITPHAGEMGRLTGRSREEVQATREETAGTFASQHGVTVVLKGAGTVVTDGERVYRNTTGSHALARGGTGDILAGLLTGLLAIGLGPFDAATLATYVHGLAGDLAEARLGATGMTATDVATALPDAWRTREGS